MRSNHFSMNFEQVHAVCRYLEYFVDSNNNCCNGLAIISMDNVLLNQFKYYRVKTSYIARMHTCNPHTTLVRTDDMPVNKHRKNIIYLEYKFLIHELFIFS